MNNGYKTGKKFESSVNSEGIETKVKPLNVL